ncbi:MAG: hypothetical protein H6705_00065 [Myxococcales bacterium]|nr:hypothetical protein [Myxococcales bacterium]
MHESPPRASGRRWRVWVEAAAALGVAVTLDVLLGRLGAPAEVGLPLYLAAAVIAGLRGGFGPGLLTALLGLAADLARLPDGRSAAQVLAGAACLIGASLIGLAVERLVGRVGHLEHVVAALRAAPEPAAESPARGRTDGLPRLLYRYARLLNVTDEGALYAGLALTLPEALPAEAVAVFRLTPAGPVHAAGDALRPPDPAALDFGGGRVVEVEGLAVAQMGEAGGPPAALVVALGVGAPGRQASALRLLAVFAEWGSTVLAHARAQAALPAASRVESAERAEARGRAAARTFVRTGRLPLVPAASGAPGRDTLRERAAVPFGFDEGDTPIGPPPTGAEDTERVDAPFVDELLDSGLLEEASGDERVTADDAVDPPSLIVGAARASMRLEAIGEARDRRRRSGRLPALDGKTVIDPATPPIDDAEPAPRPAPTPRANGAAPPVREADAIAPEVRRAIERMARRLAAPPLPRPVVEGEEALGREVAVAMEHYAMPGFEGETVAAHELPLIGGAAFGAGVAQELGRSVSGRRFATLLAHLGDHLDDEPGPTRG